MTEADSESILFLKLKYPIDTILVSTECYHQYVPLECREHIQSELNSLIKSDFDFKGPVLIEIKHDSNIVDKLNSIYIGRHYDMEYFKSINNNLSHKEAKGKASTLKNNIKDEINLKNLRAFEILLVKELISYEFSIVTE